MRGGVGAAVMAAMLVGGCLRDELVECGDGRACAIGTVCATLTATSDPLCLAPDVLGACAGAQALDACGPDHACYESSAGLACLPAGCGNRIVDRDEVCDDGNDALGDGCAPGCQSTETCGNGVVDPAVGEQCDDGNRIGYDGCASDCSVETPQWEPLQFTSPAALSGAAMAYDSGRGRVVMFGGMFQQSMTSLPVLHAGTFEWDGAGWSTVATPVAPSKRVSTAIAYDAARRRIVLFGGSQGGTVALRDTWEFDGVTWTLRQPATSPPARYGAGMVYDGARRRVVMFGGASTTALSDLWEWDGTTWSEVTLATHPASRSDHLMVYDPVRAVTVIAGGVGAGETGTWEYDGTTWRMIGAAPAQMIDSAGVFDGTRIVAFGGRTGGTTQSIMWEYVANQWSQITPSGMPTPRYRSAIAMDPTRQSAVLFGGRYEVTSPPAQGTFGDTYIWSANSWASPVMITPQPRTLHAGAYDIRRAQTIVFGGATDAQAGGTPLGDTQILDGAHWTTVTTAGPPARWGAAMSYDVGRDETVLFGGAAANYVPKGDTWRWDGGAWSPIAVSGPSPRVGAAMAYDRKRKVMVLFGGDASSTVFADTWLWDGTTWQPQTPPTSPPPRYLQAMTYDPVRERVVMFGGYGDSSQVIADDTWEWDGTTWSQVQPASSPTARGQAALVFDPARKALALYGGSAGQFTPFGDVWELAGSTWTQQAITNAPAEHQGHTMAPLADGTGVLSVCGGPYNATADALRLRWTNDHPHELCTIDVDGDGDGLAGCADPDCWAHCTPLCSPGAACDPTAPRCGDGVCNSALENCRLCPGDCGACSPICGDNFCDPGETVTSCKGDCS